MNANHFRRLYDYHFAMNHRLWDACIVPLSPQQFREALPYSVGSVRNQVVHLFNMEECWFSALRLP